MARTFFGSSYWLLVLVLCNGSTNWVPRYPRYRCIIWMNIEANIEANSEANSRATSRSHSKTLSKTLSKTHSKSQGSLTECRDEGHLHRDPLRHSVQAHGISLASPSRWSYGSLYELSTNCLCEILAKLYLVNTRGDGHSGSLFPLESFDYKISTRKFPVVSIPEPKTRFTLRP